jgi:gliding motility-associated-like protein
MSQPVNTTENKFRAFCFDSNTIQMFGKSAINKTILLILGFHAFSFSNSFSQEAVSEGMTVKKENLTHITALKISDGPAWYSRNRTGEKNHPEWGVLPDNAPCNNCVEDYSQRTESSRFFWDLNDTGKFYQQKAYGRLHYFKNGHWLTIQPKIKPTVEGDYAALSQTDPIILSPSKKSTSIATPEKTIWFNRWKLFGKKADGSTVLLAEANWTDYTAGDDGLYIRNVFPGIDAKLISGIGNIKTNFIVKHLAFDEFDALLFQDEFISEGTSELTFSDPTQKAGSGKVLFSSDGKALLEIDPAIMYTQDNERKDPLSLEYMINDNQLGIPVKTNIIEEWLTAYGEVIIDPLVSSSNSLAQASILGSGYNATCFNGFCTYNLSVPTPANSTVTNVLWSFDYRAYSANVCWMSDGAVSYFLGTCRSPAQPNLFWFCNINSAGDCQGTNVSIFNDISGCLPPPSCAPQNLNFSMRFHRCYVSGGCSNTCIGAISPWTMTVEGRTVEHTSATNPINLSSTTVCAGQSLNASTSASFGVPPYTYNWSLSPTGSPSVGTGANASISFPNPGSVALYSIVTDACGIQSTTSTFVTVNQSPTVNANPAIQAICSGLSAPINLTSSPTGATFSWTASGTGVSGFANGSGATINQTLTTTGGTPGTVTYTITPSLNNCPGPTATATVTVNPPTTPSFNPIGPLCQNSTAPALPATSTNGISGTWNPPNINTTIAQTSTYAFTPNAGQCATPGTLNITVNPQITPSFNPIGPLCQNSATPALPTTSINGITGTWNPANINTGSTGATNYLFTPNTGQCATSGSITVTVTSPVTPVFNNIGPLCQNSTPPALPATSTNGISGTWNPPNINTTIAQTTTYTFTPNGGQCATPGTLNITVTPQITPTFNTIGPLCENSTPPALTPTSTNGITGTWNPVNINTGTTGATNYLFTPNTGQCASSGSITVTVTPPVAPVFNAVGPLCQNSTPPALPATSTNGISGTWNPAGINTVNAGTSSYTFTPNAGQCANTGSLSIVINPLPAVNAGGDAFICQGAGIQLNGNGAGSLQWTPATGLNNATVATPTASPQATTTYTLTATLNGCQAVDQVVVNVTIPAPISAPNDTAICLGDCVMLPVSGGLYYSWNPSAGLDDSTSSAPTACPTATTAFTVTAFSVGTNSVANGNFESGNTGFSGSYSYSSDVQPESTYFITTNASLNHPAFVGTDHTTGSGNFMVINGSSTANTTVWCQNINVQANTDYVFSTWVSSMVASNPAILQFSINGIPLGNPFTAPGSVNVWEEFFAPWTSGTNTNATICIVNQNTATGGNDFGLDDILFSAVCQNTETVTVTVNTPSDATIANAGPFCQNEPSVNLISASPGGVWTGPGIINTATGSFNPATAGPGTHTISYTFPGACGTSDTQTITVYPNQVNAPINASICEGESYSLGGQTFTSSGLFQVTFQNMFGCDSVAALNLTVIPALNPTIVPSANQLCFDGHSFDFSASGVSPGAQCNWTFTNGSPGNSVSANPQDVVFPAPGTYPVSLTVSENGCEAQAATDITVLANPQVDFSIFPALGCAPHTATFSNQSTPAGGTFLWSFGNGQSSTAASPVYSYPSPGSYTVTLTVTGANGCTGQLIQPAAVSVLPPPLPGFTVQPPQADINNPTVSLISGADPGYDIFYLLPNGTTIQGPNNQVSFSQPGVYEIIQVVISPGGCTDTAYGQVIINGVSEIFIPNAFTPNEDFINSGFGVTGNGFTDFHLWIFNRWGELLFETVDADEKWNGTRNGKALKSDVYIYKIEYTDYKGRLQSLMGHVTLIR